MSQRQRDVPRLPTAQKRSHRTLSTLSAHDRLVRRTLLAFPLEAAAPPAASSELPAPPRTGPAVGRSTQRSSAPTRSRASPYTRRAVGGCAPGGGSHTAVGGGARQHVVVCGEGDEDAARHEPGVEEEEARCILPRHTRGGVEVLCPASEDGGLSSQRHNWAQTSVLARVRLETSVLDFGIARGGAHQR